MGIPPRNGWPTTPVSGQFKACDLDQLLLVVVRDVSRVEVDPLEGEHAVRGDAVVADRHRVQEGTGGHGRPMAANGLRVSRFSVAAIAQPDLTKRY
jgi:hypothetical protein